MKKGYWQTREGTVLSISKMETTHIYNCMRFLMGGIVLDPVFNATWDSETLIEHIRFFDSKYHEFEYEFLKRLKKLKRRKHGSKGKGKAKGNRGRV